MTDLVF